MHDELRSFITERIGTASTLFMGKDGVFDTKQAEKLVDEIMSAIVEELEQFRTNTGQYEIERNYKTPTGSKNWNADVKARNSLRKSLDDKLVARINELKEAL